MSSKSIVCDDHVEIWVSSDTTADVVAQHIADCASMGLPIVIYRSGDQDLAELTCALIRGV